jgi:hypothetical protein
MTCGLNFKDVYRNQTGYQMGGAIAGYEHKRYRRSGKYRYSGTKDLQR